MKQLTMTKVLTPLAALAFAFGVQAAVSTDGFESYAENASVTNATGWSFTAGNDGADDASFVTTYTTAGIAAPASCPDGTTAGSNFLKLSTEDGMLFRNMDGENGDSVFLSAGAGLFVDTDVQFTITDPSDRPEVKNDDKFIVWLEANGSATNLCVWAREFTVANDAVSVTSNKVYKLVSAGEPVDIVAGSWHRLTVKAIQAVGATYTFPAFQVFVDGVQFQADTEYIVDSAGELAFKEKVGDSVVNDQLYFPAMADTMESLEKIGFSGEGAIDNVVVTKSVPAFEEPTTITFNFDTSVISSIDIDDLGMTLTSSGSTVAAYPGQTFELTLNFANDDSASYTVTTASTTEYATIDDLEVTTVGFGASVITITTTPKDSVDVTFNWSALAEAMDARFNECTAITFTYGDTNVVVSGGDLTGRSKKRVIEGLKVHTNITVAVTYSTTDWSTTVTPATANVSCSGYVVTINSRGDGTATVNISAALAAAKVGDTYYPTFADALANANGATIQLLQNLTVAEPVAVANGADVTIDLAGKNITCNSQAAAAVFSVADGGTLTITNSTVDVGIVSKGDAAACIINLGTLNLQAGKFEIANGAISGGTINVTGGAYNAATFAGATLPEGMDLAQDTGALDAYAYVLAVDNSVARIAGGAKYDTLAGAITNAAAGDTVIVLKDCEVTEPITFTQGITVSNDFTVTVANNGSITYAYRVINGTSTPVTLCGTGTFTESGSPSGSQFLVGFTVTRYETAPTAGSLVLDGCTVTNGQSNVIKVENGTFTMNGGVINAAGLRAVKADGEDGANSATVTINGGAINSTKAAVAVSSKADKGEATATINGGTIAGPVTDEASAVALSSITIPSTSTARFDRDQTAYCVADYKTVLSDGWYVVAPMEYYTAISLNKASTSLVTNETETLTATLTPASAADDSVTWTTSDATVATVEGGVVTAVGAGTATITAATENYSATCTVTVTAPSPAAADWVADSSTVEGKTAAQAYSELAGTALATADAKKLTDWAKANSVTFVTAEAPTDTIVEAYLLNCAATAEAVATEKAAFKLNITVNGSTVTVTLPDGKTYNGALQMKGSNDLSNWTNVESASSSYKFYKYSLSL